MMISKYQPVFPPSSEERVAAAGAVATSQNWGERRKTLGRTLDAEPLTRRFAPTSPLRGEVKIVLVPTLEQKND